MKNLIIQFVLSCGILEKLYYADADRIGKLPPLIDDVITFIICHENNVSYLFLFSFFLK